MKGRMKLFFGIVLVLAVSACTVSEAPKEWEYRSEIVTYSDECLAEAIEPFGNDETIKNSVQMAQGDSALALANTQQAACFDHLSSESAQKIVEAYVGCARRFEETYLAEMGQQRWEMVSLSKLEETVPGGQWCRDLIVGYGFDVAWKRVK